VTGHGRLEALLGRPKISSFDPRLSTFWTAYTTHHSRRSCTHQSSWPAADHVADLHLNRRIDFCAIGLVALAVLINRDVEVCRLLVSLVFGEISNPPAHHSDVEDHPEARADMASIEPHY
jgi:hypothetical protein